MPLGKKKTLELSLNGPGRPNKSERIQKYASNGGSMTTRKLRMKLAIPFLLGATAATAGLASCGGQMNNQPRPGDRSGAPSSPASAGIGDTALTIVVDDGEDTVTTWQLSCNPVGGDHPDTDAACQALDENGASALPSVPEDLVCTQSAGGHQSATVTGIWQGQKINSDSTSETAVRSRIGKR